jgi:hypothetical protein
LPTIYVSGANASLEMVRAVADRLAPIEIAVLFAGGAKTVLLGDDYLTLSSPMAAQAVRLLGRPRTVVVHVDGWAHVTEPLRPSSRPSRPRASPTRSCPPHRD